jgi:hypothetical protein
MWQVSAWENTPQTPTSRPVTQRFSSDTRRTGDANELRRAFALFDVNHNGDLAEDEVDRAAMLLRHAGLSVDMPAIDRFKLDIALQFPNGLYFEEFVRYVMNDSTHRDQLSSLLDKRAIDALVARVQSARFNVVGFVWSVLRYLLLPVSFLLYMVTRSRSMLPPTVSSRPGMRFVPLLLWWLCCALPVYADMTTDAALLSHFEHGMPWLMYVCIALIQSSLSSTEFPESEVASRIQKCLLDRTRVKLPYDRDVSDAGHLLMLLLNRYRDERPRLLRNVIYVWSHPLELLVMVGASLGHVVTCLVDRAFVSGLPLWPAAGGSLAKWAVVCSVIANFFLFSIILSHMNVVRLRLLSKRLRLELFNALTNVSDGTRARVCARARSAARS